MLLTVTKEERTLLRKAIIPRWPELAATPCRGAAVGQAGVRGGVPLHPPGPGSRKHRYLFLDQPPALTGSHLGSSAAANSASSPCPRPRHRQCWRGGAAAPSLPLQGEGGGVTAWGPPPPTALSCTRPCRPTLPGRHGCGQGRGHGTSVPGPAGWANVSPVPACIPPTLWPPSCPTASPALPVTRHTALCAARRAGSAPGQSHPV